MKTRIQFSLAVLAVLAIGAPGWTGFSKPVYAASQPAWFGVLGSRGTYSAQEKAAGTGVATLHLGWDNYEPANGQFSSTYVSQQKQLFNNFRAAGLQVTLDPGLQYPPSWVGALDAGSRFVNQNGDVWLRPQSSGDNAVNAVFDTAVQKAEATYIQRLGADFGDNFFAIRVGGLTAAEMKYPGKWGATTNNAYWAFDVGANAQKPALIAKWKPGNPSPSGEAAAFLDFYTNSLRNYQIRLLNSFNSAFPAAHLEVLYGSFGLRPGDITKATADNLNGGSSPEINGETQYGDDFAKLVAAIPTPALTWPYTTWLNEPHTDTSLQYETPAAYLAYLGGQRGMRAAGENTHPTDSLKEMQLCVTRVVQLGLAGMSWMNESELVSGSSPSLADYGSLVSQISSASITSSPSPSSFPSVSPTSNSPRRKPRR